MNTLSFLNAPLLWGMGLASIPLIIHLLFRRRYRRIEWAPMHYLKLTIQRNRKRIRIEQILLLLLRTAMIATLVLLVSRPVMHADGLGAWLSGVGRTSQLIILDDSLSMGLKHRGQSSFAHAKELATRLVHDLGVKTRITLVLASRPETPLLREVELEDDQIMNDLMNDLEPTDSFVDWTAVLKSADELLSASQYPIREVTVVTDLRRAGWGQSHASVTDRWLEDDVRVRIFDVGLESNGNLALVGLERTDRVSLVGVPTRFVAIIRNFGVSEVAEADANWIVDGRPTLVRLPSLPPRETARVPLTASFAAGGVHHVELSLPNDDLTADDSRWLAFDVAEKLNMLLVDGEPGSDPFTSETDFLSLALSLGLGDAEAYDVEIASESDWIAALNSHPDLVIFANLASFTSTQATRLQKLVEAGVGVAFFVGDQVDPDNYNQQLFSDGQGLLPAALEAVVDEEVTGLAIEPVSPSPLDALSQLNPAVLERIGTRKFFQTRPTDPNAEGVRILARWNNPNSSPAILEKRFGRGHVLLWTIAADKAWSDWPTEPSYVLTIREAAAAIAQAGASDRNLTAGDSLRRFVPLGHEVSEPTVEVPHGQAPVAMQVIEAAGLNDQSASAKQHVLAHADTRRAGSYRLSWRETPGGEQHDLFTVSPDPRESDLARLTTDEIRTAFGALKPEIVAAVDQSESLVAIRGQEIWRALALGMLGLVMVEACFATWAGRQR